MALRTAADMTTRCAFKIEDPSRGQGGSVLRPRTKDLASRLFCTHQASVGLGSPESFRESAVVSLGGQCRKLPPPLPIGRQNQTDDTDDNVGRRCTLCVGRRCTLWRFVVLPV